MNLKKLLAKVTITAVGVVFSSALYAQSPIYTLDFSKASGDAEDWFENNGWELKSDADDMNPKFNGGKFTIKTDDDDLGLFTKQVNIRNARRVRIEWGVTSYPKGADWEKGVYREAISFVMSFGKKKIASGASYVPDVPYFISLFLGEKEKEGKKYIGNYYKKGGHYYCIPCGNPAGTTIITEYEIPENFKKTFGQSSVPTITGIAFEIDVRDTDGKSAAFVKKIEFY